MDPFLVLVAVIAAALTFSLVNGWHDGASSISAVVYTGGLKPRSATAVSAVFNFLGPLVVGTAVAKTIGTEIIPEGRVTLPLALAALLSAIAWDCLTWVWGLPVSSGHALVGGLVGAGVASYGLSGVKWWDLIEKVVVPMAASPLAGFSASFAVMKCLSRLSASSTKLNKYFNLSQIPLAAFLSFSHGANDAQKTVGVIAMVLAAFHNAPFRVPAWVPVACAAAMGLGTYLNVKSWRIMKTLGERITQLEPPHGCSANLSASLVIFLASIFGAPVSTTHVATSSIAGVGASFGLSRVSWRVIKSIIVAWATTLPFCMGVGALIYWALMKAVLF